MRRLGMIIVAAGAIAAPLLSRSDRGVEAQQVAAHSDALLLDDISRATAEFARRLHERVRVADGMVLVSDIPELKEIEGFPKTVSCGPYFGLSLTFGSGTSQARGIIEVELSNAPLTEAQCRVILPAVGKEIAALLS